MTTEDAPIKTTRTSLEVLETLRRLDGANVSELAKQLDMPTSTIHDHLHTLQGEGYLVKDGGAYRIGLRFLAFAEHARSRTKVYDVGLPEVDSLAERTGKQANLFVEEHGLAVLLYEARGEDADHLDTHVGMRLPLQTTAAGKTILAHRDRDTVRTILDEHGLPAVTGNTTTDREELFDELETIRQRGYAFDDEERAQGVRSVAAPVVNEHQEPIAAVSVSGPKNRMQGKLYAEEIPRLVRRSSDIVEVELRYA